MFRCEFASSMSPQFGALAAWSETLSVFKLAAASGSAHGSQLVVFSTALLSEQLK